MLVIRRLDFVKGSVRAILATTALVFVVVETGCESTPIRAIRGARHYAAGTEALTRSDGVQAIAELERAADLVPHASEIQNHLGLAYWSDGRAQAAQVAFERAIELDCDNLVAQANLQRLMRSGNVAVEVRVEDANGADDNDE